MATNKPSRLDLSVCGYMGTSYTVALKRGVLHHVTYGCGCVPEKKSTVRPTEEQWISFLAALDSLRVWRWRSRHEEPGVCGGTSWKAEITWGDKSIETSGCNSFPRAFEAYLEAVRTLLGGLEFQ